VKAELNSTGRNDTPSGIALSKRIQDLLFGDQIEAESMRHG
jgi:hypothetical protein